MLDHVNLPVSDFARSMAFYRAALAPLGFVVGAENGDDGGSAGFGPPGKPRFWIASGTAPKARLHIAFVADDHDAVRRFHSAALAAGGTDNGAPGIRAEYHASYYAAFVFDPDGHNIEAVCHFPGRFQDQFPGSKPE